MSRKYNFLYAATIRARQLNFFSQYPLNDMEHLQSVCESGSLFLAPQVMVCVNEDFTPRRKVPPSI